MALSAFTRDLLSRIPEADRAAVEAALSKPEAADAVTFLDQGAARQSDYSRAQDQLREQRAELDRQAAKVQEDYQRNVAWYEANQPVLEAGKAALAAGGVPARTEEPIQPPTGVTREEMQKFVNDQAAGVVPFVAENVRLAVQHFKQFGEELDLAALMADPQIGKLGLRGVYQKTFATQIEQVRAQAEQKRIDELVNTQLAERLKAAGNRPVYPVGPHDPSPLDVLEVGAQKPDPSQFSAQAAADEYLALVGAKA